ncbi:DUF4173 domain-containing protein [Aquibacillus halophilus]|uniref:DUF4173 domain-containing protein n=1 Tax=Aquibacillus halophilus TaxID=930132 RepID=A0A6A8DG33_9BACI|nr:DUF4173 domain-containing protein [Aquibacillus halophilus]MRH44180.1 DUF4173 domain-containing protein [Aquibacillus halophilus]
MEIQVKSQDFWFLLVCLGLGILTELSFFHGTVGVSYLVFLTGFYIVFFIRFRLLVFTHRRIGLLLMMAIWILSASYLVYDNQLFYQLNFLVIPALILCHIVLITVPKQVKWYTPRFLQLVMEKLAGGIRFNSVFFSEIVKSLFKNMDEQTAHTIKRVALGLVIGLPLLGIVTILLMSADAVFQDLVVQIPRFIFQLNFGEQLFRIAIILFFLLVFFGIFQVLALANSTKLYSEEVGNGTKQFDSIIALTILILLNGVYLLFTAIQFTYFFGGGLEEGYTFAEYARRGFFELMIVTMVNWTLLISFLTYVKESRRKFKFVLKVMYSIVIIVSGIMLTSAFQRLSMYEEAYGFTLDRILAHGFMVFLLVIFAYTMMRVWLEKLSLLHFYLLASLIFYTGLNVIPLERMIVNNNLERYQATDKIDVYYLNSLGATGVDGLITLYQKEPDFPNLKRILVERKEWAESINQRNSWQSYNLHKQAVIEKLTKLNLTN